MLSKTSSPSPDNRKIIWALACAVYLVTAWNSSGYYHEDEHYQIIEFAHARLGKCPTDALAWEYAAGIRSALQPTIAYFVIGGLDRIGVTDPYDQTFVLRVMTACLALAAIAFFLRMFTAQVEARFSNVLLILSLFLWFLPALNVRFSSETWAGLVFLWALGCTQLGGSARRRNMWVGLLLGVCFLLRCQSAIMAAGLVAWMLLVRKERVAHLAWALGAGLLVVLLGIALDSWFYGRTVFTAWNYFHVNVIEGRASAFGTFPWYRYGIWMMKLPTWPIGVAIMLALGVLLIRAPRTVLLWCIVPYILVHMLIPHKEDRFLFPLLNMLPILIVLAYQQVPAVQQWFARGRFQAYAGGALLIALLVINTTGLAAMAVKSAGVGRMAITEHLHRALREEPHTLISLPTANPYDPFDGMPARYYDEQGQRRVYVASPADLSDSLLAGPGRRFIVLTEAELGSTGCAERLARSGFHREMQGLPDWVDRLIPIYHVYDDEHRYLLYANVR